MKCVVWQQDKAPKYTFFLIRLPVKRILGLKSVIEKEKICHKGMRGRKSVTYYLNGHDAQIFLIKRKKFNYSNDKKTSLKTKYYEKKLFYNVNNLNWNKQLNLLHLNWLKEDSKIILFWAKKNEWLYNYISLRFHVRTILGYEYKNPHPLLLFFAILWLIFRVTIWPFLKLFTKYKMVLPFVMS